MADLIFNSLEGRLYGQIAGYNIDCLAVSGGRGGSKVAGAGVDILQNNFLSSSVRLGPSPVGGTLPLGEYTMTKHEHKPNMIRLTPTGQAMHGRSGFLIYGRGERGSDGCIVPFNFEFVKIIYKAVIQHNVKNAANPILSVIAAGDVDQIIERSARWN